MDEKIQSFIRFMISAKNNHHLKPKWEALTDEELATMIMQTYNGEMDQRTKDYLEINDEE